MQGDPGPVHVRQDLLRGFGPHKRFGMGIALGDVRGNQLRDTAKHSATNLFGRQVSKDAFHQIEPRTTGRGEMHLGARVALQHRWTVGCLCAA